MSTPQTDPAIALLVLELLALRMFPPGMKMALREVSEGHFRW